MSARLKKEFHPLLLPWVVAVGCVAVAAALARVPGAGEFVETLAALAKVTFLGGLVLLASLSFGTELQQRTLPLLLSQPVDRGRVWTEKLLVLTLSVVAALLAVALLPWLLSLVYSSPSPGTGSNGVVSQLFGNQEAPLVGVFLLATVCSCGFWTLVAGSSIGGAVFTVAVQFFCAVAVAAPIAWIHNNENFDDSQTFPALIVAGLVYSAVFLWLSWKKFARLEIRNAGLGQTAAQSSITNWKLPWAAMFISRPGERVGNLVRKELRLERPVFLLGAFFIVCWLAAVLLQWLRPKQNITYVFDVLTCVYAPLASLLAGCVPLGEEKALGLTSAQLTLPFSQTGQWLAKLFVGLGIVAVVCLGLPLCLFWATGGLLDLSTTGLMNPNDNGLLALSVVCGLVFLCGYWAISLVNNTVWAALVAVGCLVVLGASSTLGVWLGQQSNGWQTGPLVAMMCHFQWAPDTFRSSASSAASVIFFGALAGIVVLSLCQSLTGYRASNQARHKLFLYSLILSFLVVGLAAWSVDTVSAITSLFDSGPARELRAGLDSFASKDAQVVDEQEHVVSSPALQAKTRFSDLTRIWLRNATLSYRFLPPKQLKDGNTEHAYAATVSFPNGQKFSFNGGFVRGPRGVKLGI